MKVPTDAQARLLERIAAAEAEGIAVEVREGDQHGNTYGRSYADLVVEKVDREENTSRIEPFSYHRDQHRIATLNACLRNGWFSTLHVRERTMRLRRPSPDPRRPSEWTITLRQLDTTEDGVIALGVWRQRKLKGPPPALPVMSPREREVAELAQRALDLGYALCALKPVRAEANRMRREGWFGGCWVANSATGLVPTPMALVEMRPDQADRP